MNYISIFDIAGPIMVGPSSSHTAGACKIGQFARALFHGTPKKATFYLHGSFGKVYKGHATDRALLAGVLKFRTSDPRIKDSFKYAKQKNLKYEFIVKDLGKKYHPNTVKIVLENSKRKMEIIGSSVGGGIIEINKIDNFDIKLKGRAGKYLSLIVQHDRKPGIIKKLIIKINKLGIETVNVEKTFYKNKTLSVLSTEGRRITLPEVIELERSSEGVDYVRSLSKLEKQ
ncbi:L-serine ammonia-lyase, iron-sulfur-dependent, subunit beta [Candidatus Peregrinibacteria bacterium]|nr:L-serine ammonia-lyase, iron-sulfur-dependent, subunit beta [Candidatus Peregrinibacteria bacterium]